MHVPKANKQGGKPGNPGDPVWPDAKTLSREERKEARELIGLEAPKFCRTHIFKGCKFGNKCQYQHKRKEFPIDLEHTMRKKFKNFRFIWSKEDKA